MPGRTEPVDKKQLGDTERALEECGLLEAELAELKAKFEQFFLGVERHPPSKQHEDVRKRVQALKGLFLRQTAVKFRVQALAAKLVSYERLWDRTIKEIEAGTYRRDVYKARLHQQKKTGRAEPAAKKEAAPVDEDLDVTDLGTGAAPDGGLAAAVKQAEAIAQARPTAPPAIAPVIPPVGGAFPAITPIPPVRPVAMPAPNPSGPGGRPIITPPLPGVPPVGVVPPRAGSNPRLPVPAPRPSAPGAGGDGGLSEQKIKAIYEAYVMAKKRCGEDTRALTLDSVASTLKKQVPELMRQHNARSVEFKVVIKDGKAVLRALPKDS